METTTRYGVRRAAVRALAAAAVAAWASAARAAGGQIPSNIVQQLTRRLPAAVAPMPASGQARICPLASETSVSIQDRKCVVQVDAEPLAMTAISPDGRKVQLSVRSGADGKSWEKRWFKAEDVFGKVKWNIEAYEPKSPCLVYFPRGKAPPELVRRFPAGKRYASLGTVEVGKAPFRLVQTLEGFEAGGEANTVMVVLVRENPPVATQADYDARAKQMMDEHAFRSGRPWGERFPAILGDKHCFECAAMASDAVAYMFGGKFGKGERFEKVDEIRSGDIVHFKSHYIFVIYRRGSQLVTIEGNMNKHVRQSAKHYSVSGGKFFAGGEEREFTHGFHYWPLQK